MGRATRLKMMQRCRIVGILDIGVRWMHAAYSLAARRSRCSDRIVELLNHCRLDIAPRLPSLIIITIPLKVIVHAIEVLFILVLVGHSQS